MTVQQVDLVPHKHKHVGQQAFQGQRNEAAGPLLVAGQLRQCGEPMLAQLWHSYVYGRRAFQQMPSGLGVPVPVFHRWACTVSRVCAPLVFAQAALSGMSPV